MDKIKKTNIILSLCLYLLILFSIISCSSQLAKESDKDQDYLDCEKESESNKGLCIAYKAINKLDYNKCASIKDQEAENYCYHRVAVKIGDSSICYNIIDLTGEIKYYNNQVFCIAETENDITKCEELKNNLVYNKSYSHCVKNIAVNLENASLCKTDGCFYDIATKTGEEDLCKNIEHDEYRNQCFLESAKI